MYWQINFGKEQFSIIKQDILITHEFAPFYGGVATYCTEVAAAASKMDGALSVLVPGKASPSDAKNVIRMGGQVSLRLPQLLHFAYGLGQHRSLWAHQRVFLGSLGAHWIFAHFWRLGLARKVSMVPIFHGSEILRFEQNPWWRSLAMDWLKSCDRILAASAFTQKRLQDSFLMPPGKQVELAPCAVREGLVAESRQLSGKNRSVDDRDPTINILTLARLHPRKGQADVIRALGLLPESLRGTIVYQLAGTGEVAYQQELQELGRGLGVKMKFLGMVSDAELGQIYAACDLYVMSSRTLPRSIEGFGMTYLEAGVFGKPVVGYRTGGVEGAVLHETTGLLVEEGNLPELSQAIQRFLEDRALGAKMGEEGRRHALSFDWVKTATTLFQPKWG